MDRRVDAGLRSRLVARFGDQVESWLAALPAALDHLTQAWAIEIGAPIPRGSMSAVFHCHTSDGQATVLKASPDRKRLAVEAAALNAWDTVHAPAVIAVDEDIAALLIEAIEPGTPLVVSLPSRPPLRWPHSWLPCTHQANMSSPGRQLPTASITSSPRRRSCTSGTRSWSI